MIGNWGIAKYPNSFFYFWTVYSHIRLVIKVIGNGVLWNTPFFFYLWMWKFSYKTLIGFYESGWLRNCPDLLYLPVSFKQTYYSPGNAPLRNGVFLFGGLKQCVWNLAILLARRRHLLFGRTSYHNAKDNGIRGKFQENNRSNKKISIFFKKK